MSSIKKTMMTDRIWFPALNVAAHFEADFVDIKVPKKVEEMMSVAIAIAAIQEIQNKQYWIQGVSDQEQSPDVRTMCCDQPKDGKAPMCYQQDVEVVSYTEYSTSQALVDFVATTKFAKDTAYDDLTTILVYVKTKTRLPSAKKWSSVLSKTGKNNPVFVLGRINPQKPEYRLAIVHPIVEGAVDYNAPELLRKQGYTSVMKWSRGTRIAETYDPNEKHCPFEKFGISCKLLK